jgi:glyoxylase-like metal-dependent hydrolase (beta-lactamase superfamily II)
VSADEVAPGITRVRSKLGSRWLQQWVVRGGDGALLLDTGIAGETVGNHIEPGLRAAGLEPQELRHVVISHADVDHYGGNAEIRRLAPHASIRAHELDRPLIESVDRIEQERYGWYRRHELDYTPEQWSWIRDAAGSDLGLDASLADGDAIDLGDSELEVVHVPGHSQGHVALWHGGTRTALIADAVMGRGFVGTDGRPQVHPPAFEDVDAYLRAIARVRELAPARVCTGHFPLLEDDEVAGFLDASASFVDDVDAALRSELADEPRSLGSLLPDCARRLGGFEEMELELARSLGAHLERLEAAEDAQRLEGKPPTWRR